MTEQHKGVPTDTTVSRRTVLASLAPTMLASAASHGDVASLARALVDVLPAAAGCRRAAVALAASASQSLKLVALSGQATIDPRRDLSQRLCACLGDVASEPRESGRRTMEAVFWPPAPDAGNSTPPSLASHARKSSAVALAVLVLHDGRGGRAGVLLERGIGQRSFAVGELRSLVALLEHPLALLLREKRRAAPWHRRAIDAWHDRSRHPCNLCKVIPARVRELLTPAQATVALAAAATLLVGFVPVPMTVVARATLEAVDRQVVTAAQDGLLLSAHARAGDRVDKGQLLARLDDRAAALELDAIQGDAARVEEELARALAIRDRESLGRLRADRVRVAADVAGAQRRLAHGRLEAPFDGVVLKGDLSSQLGAPVVAGDVLFEIGSAERRRLMLEIDERDVRLVDPGQLARVRMAGVPNRDWQVRLGDLQPVATAEPGRNVFRVPGTLLDETDLLLPGMQGVGRIRVGRAALGAVVTRSLRERLVLLAWRLGLIA